MSDTPVHCIHCGRTEKVSFSHCLRHGWPECCGGTMHIVGTLPDAVIESAVADAFAPARAAAAQLEQEAK